MDSSLIPNEPNEPNENEAGADDDRIVCFCHSVKFHQILAVIKNGKCTLAEIQNETLASTGCGGCEWDVTEILEQFSKKVDT